jgi:hypothetical protein
MTVRKRSDAMDVTVRACWLTWHGTGCYLVRGQSPKGKAFVDSRA